MAKRTPAAYTAWLQTVKSFYEELAKPENESIKNGLLSYNTTEEELTNATALIQQTEQLKGELVREQAESQDATKNKNKALKTMELWMQTFYAMATDALINNLQLLEALGIHRKS